MKRAPLKPRLSFQSKVLIPVVSVMVLLVLLSLIVVNRRITSQVRQEVADRLITSNAALRNLQKIRSRNLLLRYRNVPNEPRFKAMAQLADAKTTHAFLEDLMTELDCEVLLYATEQGELLAGATRDPSRQAGTFFPAAEATLRQAMGDQTSVSLVLVDGALYDLVSVPVRIVDSVVGVLTCAVEMGETAAREFKQLTGSEVIFRVDGRPVVSTLKSASLSRALQEHFEGPGSTPTSGTLEEQVVRNIEIDREHYLGLADALDSNGRDREIGYVLLSSYEPSLRALDATQNALLAFSLIGILLSGTIIWLLIQKIASPLRQLRDSAEAIGRGDFSRRVPVSSRDEFGELAEVFNQMTANLLSSRESLNKTVETLKTTRDQLIQSEKLSAIGEFVAGVTHELNNPLTTVIGYTELMKGDGIEGEHREYLEQIVHAAERCQKIVKDLLGFTRQHKPERKICSLNEIVETTVRFLGYELRTSNIEVIQNLDAGLPPVVADAHQIQQVLLNLINNARQAIQTHQPEGCIHITSEAQNGHVRLLIQDNGPGIPKENLGKIFNPFFTTKEPGKGTGLGLSLSYGIIKEHGGSIVARSRRGEGALFIIELPASRATSETTVEVTVAQVPETLPAEGNGKKILVVDDEESILKLVSHILCDNGYQVDTVTDGEKALQNLRRTRYDLTVCDWKMPGLNGRDVYEQLRLMDMEAARRLMFMTGDVVNESLQQFLRDSNKVCLPKPFSQYEFRSAVSKILTTAA